MRLGTMAQTQRSAQRWQQSSSSGQSGAQCALRPTTRHATCPAAEKPEWQARRRLAVLIRSHLYCCELHSEAHLIEPCETPGGAPGSNAGGAVRETPTLTFDDVSRAIGGLGGGKPRRTGVRFAVLGAVDRALNDSGATTFADAFRIFEAERPDWQRELAKAPPRVAPGAHVIDMPDGAVEADLLRARSRQANEVAVQADLLRARDRWSSPSTCERARCRRRG